MEVLIFWTAPECAIIMRKFGGDADPFHWIAMMFGLEKRTKWLISCLRTRTTTFVCWVFAQFSRGNSSVSHQRTHDPKSNIMKLVAAIKIAKWLTGNKNQKVCWKGGKRFLFDWWNFMVKIVSNSLQLFLIVKYIYYAFGNSIGFLFFASASRSFSASALNSPYCSIRVSPRRFRLWVKNGWTYSRSSWRIRWRH